MLSKQEKIILKLLGELNGESNPEEIANTSNLPEVAVMRTLLYLSSKNLVIVEKRMFLIYFDRRWSKKYN